MEEMMFYDEKTGLWYERCGDYYYPCVTLGEEEQRPIGIWGMRHCRYLKEHKKGIYTALLLNGNQLSGRCERTGRGDVFPAGIGDDGARRRHGKAESRRSDGMGQKGQQHQKQGQGNGRCGFDLCVRKRRQERSCCLL